MHLLWRLEASILYEEIRISPYKNILSCESQIVPRENILVDATRGLIQNSPKMNGLHDEKFLAGTLIMIVEYLTAKSSKLQRQSWRN